jgi:hypothetical protein
VPGTVSAADAHLDRHSRIVLTKRWCLEGAERQMSIYRTESKCVAGWMLALVVMCLASLHSEAQVPDAASQTNAHPITARQTLPPAPSGVAAPGLPLTFTQAPSAAQERSFA